MNNALDSNEFEVLSLLGAGGAGSVYKARQIHMDRIVAVKVLHAAESASNEQLQRFQREASMLQNLQHPNIVRLFKFGTTPDARPYAVLEYLEGQSLQEYLKSRGKLTFAECLPIFEQILDGVAFAHEKGIVHRDLKPSNVLLPKAPDTVACPNVKLLDFGLAKPDATLSANGQKVTKTGAVLGTPLYMSPEQCSAQSITPRSDIYSIGCMLYECLIGQPPFSSDSYYAVLMSQIQDTPPPMPNIDAGVQELILRALQKSPENRFASATEFKEALKTAGEGRDARATKPKKRAHRANKTPRDNTRIVGVMIAIAAIMGGAYAYHSFHGPAPVAVSDDPELEQTRALKENDYATLKRSLSHQWDQPNAALTQGPHLRDRLNGIAQQLCDRIRAHFFVHSHWQPDNSEPGSVLSDGVWVLQNAETALVDPQFVYAATFSALLLAELDSQDQQIYKGTKIGDNLDSGAKHFFRAAILATTNDREPRLKALMPGLCIVGKNIGAKYMLKIQEATTAKDVAGAARYRDIAQRAFRSVLTLFEKGKVIDEALPLYYECAWHYADLVMAQGNFPEAVRYYRIALTKPGLADWQEFVRVSLVRGELGMHDVKTALQDAQALYEDRKAGRLKTPFATPFVVDFLYGSTLVSTGRDKEAVPVLEEALKESDGHVNVDVYKLAEKTLAKARATTAISTTNSKKEGRR